MRIALITPGFSAHQSDWAIPVLQTLALEMAGSHDLHIFSLRYPTREPEQFGGFVHHALKGGTRFRLGSLIVWGQALRAITAEHRRRPFDLLHAFWADEPGMVAVLASRWLRRPAIVSSAGGEFVYLADIEYGTGGSPLRRLLVRRTLQGATIVTAGSPYQLESARQQGAQPDRLRLSPFGVDTGRFTYASPAASRSLTLMQAASLTPVKNQALLLGIFRLVRRDCPDARLALVGDGPLLPALRSQAEQMGIADAVEWIGRVAHLDMPALYAGAHIYIQTSRHESQGMAVLEAMACGLPAIGTPVGVLPEVAAAPPAWEAETIAGQVLELWRDSACFERAAGEAASTVAERYGLAASLQRFDDLYAQLLA